MLTILGVIIMNNFKNKLYLYKQILIPLIGLNIFYQPIEAI